jgi:hypothetical protein
MKNIKKTALGILLFVLSTNINILAQQKTATNSVKTIINDPVSIAKVLGQKAARTIINDPEAKAKLLGSHHFSLQWISWDYFGKAVITDQKGKLVIRGIQRAKDGTDFVKMDGIITEVNSKEFKFNGVIEVKVSHNNDGNVCKREGSMTFKITQNRKYWRLQEMQSPCGVETDYVDIFFH